MNNHITLVGYVGQPPKQKIFEEGNRVCKFSVGVKEYTSKDEENPTIWFDCDAWNGLGDRAMEMVTVGREVVVHGRLILSTYPKKVGGAEVDWPKAYVKLTGFHLCGKKPVAEEEETNTEEPAAKGFRLVKYSD
jgi:single stranded DNA-binding protein